MPQPKKPPLRVPITPEMEATRRKRTGSPKPKPLPPVTPARFTAVMGIVERLAEENTDVFIGIAQGYRERHRDGTSRKLTAQEAAQIASAMADGAGLPPVTLAVAVQESDLRGYDEPEPTEILMRAGIATAPAAMTSALRFVALMEMPADIFEALYDGDTLDDELDVLVKALSHQDIARAGGVRARAQRAAEHLSQEVAGVPGKAMALLIRAQWQAMKQGMEALGYQKPSSSLTGSPPSTDGLSDTSSTSSATPAR